MVDDPYLAHRARARIGSTLRGKYRIDSVLGVGGMAVVYAATHRNTKRFALKMLHPELSMHADIRTRFLREGYAANSVGHPATVAVLDDDVAEDGAAFIVMELLDGASVDRVMQERGGTMDVRAAVAIVDKLLEVLSAAHAKGIVHRDIKPANLFLTKEGGVKVLDFGIARARDAAASGAGGGQATGTGALLGTPAFMAPEQALGKSADVDAQSDVWAASATLFNLIAGRFVHEGDNLPQLLVQAATKRARSLASVAPHVPTRLTQVVDRGLAFEKNERWPNATAMRSALGDAHRAAFGVLPDPLVLSGRDHDIGMRRVPSSPPVAPSPVVATASVAAIIPPNAPRPASLASTEIPVAALKTRQTTARPRRAQTSVVFAGGVVLAVAAVTVGIRAYRTTTGAPAKAHPLVQSATAVPSDSGASLTRAEPPAELPAAPSIGPTPSAPPPPIAVTESPRSTPRRTVPSAGASATRYVRPQASAAPVSPPPSAHANPAPNCNPPFYFDAQGSRVFKKECL